MLKSSSRRGVALLLAGLACASAGSARAADDRTAEKILAEIKAAEMPKVPANRKDQQAVQAYMLKAQKVMQQRATLIGELYKVAPENDDLVQLMPERWQAGMMMPGSGANETRAEMDRVIAEGKNPKLVNEAAFFRVVGSFQKAGRNPDPEKLGPVVEDFIRRYPKDERAALMLSALASMTDDQTKKDAITKRMELSYPNSPAVKAAAARAAAEAAAAAAERRQKEAIGKPFEITFVDAIKGGQVSSKTLMGKVVVIDFWATWCGPCVAEMPKMKDLYAKYKDQGVEFVGVSLDAPKEDGGYDKLKQFVEKNKIDWPQFYQGKGWESEFSVSWGITGIPCVFLVDAGGNLAETKARGRLEELIPEYLEKAKKADKP